MSNEVIDNADFAQVFTNVFDSEIVYDFSSVANVQNNIFLMSKNDIVANFPDLKFILPGFGKRSTLVEAPDEFEFLFTILNFFENYGKLLRKSETIDSNYTEIIAVSFYNVLTNTIEVINVSSTVKTVGNMHHLYWLQNLKENVFKILVEMQKQKMNTYIIKSHYLNFINISNNESREQENSI